MILADDKLMLWGSPVSPYVRLVRIAAHELGAADDIDHREVTPATIIDEVAPANPLAQIPTLITGDGPVFDSRSIVYWLDDRYGPRLIPRDRSAHATVMTRFALASGIIDAANLRRNLGLQPDGQRPDSFINRLAARLSRALDNLDTQCGAYGETFCADQIAAVTALGYLDFRFSEEDWRAGRVALEAWFAEATARPSAQATAHPAA